MLRRLAAVLVTVILAPIVIAQSENKSVQICAGSNIPYGYVVVGRVTTEQCRKFVDLPERDNTLVIKRPAAREAICEDSPYPGNYAVTGRARSVACPNNANENYNNALIIERFD
ncbi:MAG TPA: hypothetical protein VJ715_12385 [Pyrinomonadaceae bacterium]|nr:hypothetical protein [Pyrinomonadaceae bacterium]